MYIAHWPPEVTLQTVFEQLNYQTSLIYFLDTLFLLSIALVFGSGLVFLFIKKLGAGGVTLRISEFLFLATGIGLAVIIAELFIVALFGQLTTTVITTLFILTAIASLAVSHLSLKSHSGIHFSTPAGWFPVSLSLIFFVSVFVLQFSSASSETISDGTSYHVPYADFFLKNHGLAINYHLIYPFHSLNINILYSFALMINYELGYVQSVHALFATLTFFGIYIAAIHTGQKQWVALLMPTLFLQIFTIQFNRYTSNVDLGSMYFVFMAFFALMLWQKFPKALWLLLCSAIALGIAMGSKYLMCIFSVPIALLIIIQTRKQCLRPLLLYAACAFLWGCWWYIRNAWLTGNPVHPFATDIFGYYLWDERDMRLQMENLHNEFIPRNIFGFLAAPYFAYINPTLKEQNIAHILAAFYLALPLVAFAERRCQWLLIPCLLYLLFWSQSSSDPRYMMPLMPLMFIYIGSAVSGVFTATAPAWLYQRAWSRVTAISIGCLLSIAALSYSLLDTQQRLVKILYDGPSSVLSHETLMKTNEEYELVQHANRLFTENDTVYEFFFRNIRWFFKGNMVGTQFGEHGYLRILDQAEYLTKAGYSPEKLEHVLREKYHAVGFIIPLFAHDKAEFDAYFSLEFRNGVGSIYRFKQDMAPKAAIGNP